MSRKGIGAWASERNRRVKGPNCPRLNFLGKIMTRNFKPEYILSMLENVKSFVDLITFKMLKIYKFLLKIFKKSHKWNYVNFRNETDAERIPSCKLDELDQWNNFTFGSDCGLSHPDQTKNGFWIYETYVHFQPEYDPGIIIMQTGKIQVQEWFEIKIF